MRVMKLSDDKSCLAGSAYRRCSFLRLILSVFAFGLVIVFVSPVALSQPIQDGSSTQSDASTDGVTDSFGTSEEKLDPLAEGASREIARREALIEELRYSSGVYSDQLREVQADLGAYLIEVEDFEGAAKVYSEALQITRINTGLYSEEQLPLIK